MGHFPWRTLRYVCQGSTACDRLDTPDFWLDSPIASFPRFPRIPSLGSLGLAVGHWAIQFFLEMPGGVHQFPILRQFSGVLVGPTPLAFEMAMTPPSGAQCSNVFLQFFPFAQPWGKWREKCSVNSLLGRWTCTQLFNKSRSYHPLYVSKTSSLCYCVKNQTIKFLCRWCNIINGIGMALFPLSITLAVKQIHPRCKRLVWPNLRWLDFHR